MCEITRAEFRPVVTPINILAMIRIYKLGCNCKSDPNIPMVSVNMSDCFLEKKCKRIDEKNAPKVAPNGNEAFKYYKYPLTTLNGSIDKL